MAGALLPWDDYVSQELAASGITFTGKTMFGRDFMAVLEAIRAEDKIWIRAVDSRSAPESYLQRMFPEAHVQVPKIISEHVVPVLDIIRVGERWIFVIMPACTSTLAYESSKEKDPNLHRDWFLQTVKGLQSLHGAGYFHGDLCLKNLWIDGNNSIKLSNYSLLPVIDNRNIAATYNWRYDSHVAGGPSAKDVYALGVTMFEMFSKEILNERPKCEVYDVVVQNQIVPDSLKQLLISMVETNVQRRVKLALIPANVYFTTKIATKDSPLPHDGSNLVLGDDIDAELEELEIIVEVEIGAGAFGSVYRVKYLGDHYAMKIISIDEGENEKQVSEAIGDHPHVIKIHHFFSFPNHDKTILLMELAMTDLDKKLDELKIITPDKVDLAIQLIKKWICDYARGLAHLHSKHVAHYDIKAENVLIRINNTAAVSDFGFAFITIDETEHELDAFKCDVKSFGSFLEETMMQINQMVFRLEPRQPKEETNELMPSHPSFNPDLAIDLLSWCNTGGFGEPPFNMMEVTKHE